MTTTSLTIVPIGKGGAQVFLRDGHGNFNAVFKANFNTYQPDDEGVAQAVKDYLTWVKEGEKIA